DRMSPRPVLKLPPQFQLRSFFPFPVPVTALIAAAFPASEFHSVQLHQPALLPLASVAPLAPPILA
ncbi:MAG: hypothetical protein OEZ41_14290, partial [Nitrospirota bacterium]|nr:hypothetical protein [Nitrospirota bacterium]